MRVLHVIPSLSPQRGGPTAVALNLVRELNQLGITAEICTTNDDGPDVLDVPLGDRINYLGAPVYFFPRLTLPIGRDRAFLFSPALGRWLWQQIPTYDVLDTHYLFAFGSTATAMIARRRHVPYTMRTMGQLAPWALAQSQTKKRLYSWLRERKNLNRAAVVHCTTEGEAADVRRFGITAPTRVLPLGVYPGAPIDDASARLRDCYQLAADVPIILYLGRLHYKKRPDFLLEVLAGLKETPFHLLFAGTAHEPDYLEHLQSLVADWGLGDRVTFMGLVTGADKELVLQGSDLFVLPSFAENFAIAVAEAMAAGLPVVITPEVQLAPTVAAAEAGLVQAAELEVWQGAIAQLLHSPELRKTLGQNGRRLALEVFDWGAIARQLVAVYREAIDGHP
ncbi:MAG: glycosyltransferase [Spirulina sp. SIO3F2]|nr:glycosyltransferase [Spirulina sp. SIO3F2]